MGTGIAAHLANAGFEVLMLDMASAGNNRNLIASGALLQATKQKPAPFYHKDFIQRITVGNFEDDLEQLQSVDWTIEVIVENLDVKKHLFEQVDRFRKQGPTSRLERPGKRQTGFGWGVRLPAARFRRNRAPVRNHGNAYSCKVIFS